MAKWIGLGSLLTGAIGPNARTGIKSGISPSVQLNPLARACNTNQRSLTTLHFKGIYFVPGLKHFRLLRHIRRVFCGEALLQIVSQDDTLLWRFGNE